MPLHGPAPCSFTETASVGGLFPFKPSGKGGQRSARALRSLYPRPLRTRNFPRRRCWRLSLGASSGQFLTFCFCLIFGHLNIAFFGHAGFRRGVNRLAWSIDLLRASKTSRAICLELLSQSRVSDSPLPIKAKPNHFLLWQRKFIRAAS
jgi:hypothetical protein